MRFLCSNSRLSSRLSWAVLLHNPRPQVWRLMHSLNLDSFVIYSRRAQRILVAREMVWYVGL